MGTLGARMMGAMRADVATFEEIERDPSALVQAIAVIVIAGVAALIGNVFRVGIVLGIGNLLMALVGYAIWAVLVVVIGTKLMPEPGTKADFQEAFRVVGFAAAPGVFNVIAIIPFLGPLLSFLIAIWSLVVMVVAVRTVLDYTSTARAILVCVIGFIVYIIVTWLVLAPLFVSRALVS